MWAGDHWIFPSTPDYSSARSPFFPLQRQQWRSFIPSWSSTDTTWTAHCLPSMPVCCCAHIHVKQRNENAKQKKKGLFTATYVLHASVWTSTQLGNSQASDVSIPLPPQPVRGDSLPGVIDFLSSRVYFAVFPLILVTRKGSGPLSIFNGSLRVTKGYPQRLDDTCSTLDRACLESFRSVRRASVAC